MGPRSASGTPFTGRSIAIAIVVAAVAAILVGSLVSVLAPPPPPANVVGVWSGHAPGLFADPGRSDLVRLDVERMVNEQLFGNMRIGELSGGLTGTVRGTRLHAEIAGPTGTGEKGTLDGTVDAAHLRGKVSLQFGSGSSAGAPAVLDSDVELARAVPVQPQTRAATRARTHIATGARVASPRQLGLRAFLPVVRSGRLTAGFSVHGPFFRARNYLFAERGGKVTYAFTVPRHQTRRIGYGIPRGHVINTASLDILLGGHRIATVRGTHVAFHALAPRDALLWWRTFGPGPHRLTLAADAGSLNIYGLWTNVSPRNRIRHHH